MDLDAVVSALCDAADDFLAGVTRRDEARAGIAEMLTIHHPQLTPAERQTVADGVMRILESEGFFDRRAGGRDNDEDEETDEA
jgi:hypothetical protein